MEFNVKKRNIEYNHNSIDVKIATEYAKQIHKEMKELIIATVLYGSQAKQTSTKKSDVDILVIIDDISIVLNQEVLQTYKILSKKMATKISKDLHINTMRLSSFWDYVRNGDPIVINMLRDGIPIYDQNLFQPMQLLLQQGRIRPTKESMWNYFAKAPITLNNSKWHLLQATIDLYWAVIDSAHAALIKGDIIPPSPEHVADLLEKRYVKTKLLEKRYVQLMRKFYNLMKMISHREIKEISGSQYDVYYKEAHNFVGRMKKLID